MQVLYNAEVYTQNQQTPTAQALIIDQGVILAVGTNEEILASAPIKAEKENLDGQTVLPGFTDAHIHLLEYAKSLRKADCETPTRLECLDRVSKQVQQLRPGEWLLGHGWNHNLWPEGIGHAQLLDAISSEHPIFLTNKSLHGAWVNSFAMDQAGINALTPDPSGGKIERDAHGNPTGILLDNAVSLILNVMPEISLTQAVDYLNSAQQQLFQMGITSVHDFDRRLAFQALQLLQTQDRLQLRVLKSIPVDDMNHAIESGLRSGFGNNHLTIGHIKVFMDGALGTETAAMFEKYQNSENLGLEILSKEELVQIGIRAVRAGFPLAIHAIGDRANATTLDALAEIRQYEQDNHIPLLPHRIEHAQCVSERDFLRFKELNVIASVQPIQLISDRDTADRKWGERAKTTYAFKSLQDLGVPLIFGSDAPVEQPDCLIGIFAAAQRMDPKHREHTPWHPEQILTLADSISHFTSSPQKTCNTKPMRGEIQQGHAADLVVLKQNPYRMDTNFSKDIVSATMINGRWVWKG